MNKHTNIAPHASTRISCNNDTLLKDKGQRSCPLSRLHHLYSFLLEAIKLEPKRKIKLNPLTILTFSTQIANIE